jgi:glucose/arabinose dehydrogenase
MNFDPATGRLYVGDVGQNQQEEIDLVTLGGNYGWDCLEGELPHPTTASCTATFVPPEAVHDRSEAQAITGGAVYRGSAIPHFHGFYVYADFYSGLFFAFDSDVPDAPSELLNLSETFVAAFGQDRDGEVYTVGFGSPSIQKIVAGSGTNLAFADAFPGRSFNNPVKLVQHPTNADRWYVVEQGGLVKTFLASDSAAPTIAADVDALVSLGFGEQGLLGMAFPPGTSPGRVYLTYTDDATGQSVLARWVSSNGGLTFSPDTVVLAIPHPLNNHNGGDIVFGPDGFLYYSMGDGGGGDDPDNNGQNLSTLLGKILRLDVNGAPPEGKTYAIPAGNPFSQNAQCNTGSR